MVDSFRALANPWSVYYTGAFTPEFLVSERTVSSIMNQTSVIPVTFQSSGRYQGVFLGRGRIQELFLPAIGPAPSRKRSQTSPLYVRGVCQKYIWWRRRPCPASGSFGWTISLSLSSWSRFNWSNWEPVTNLKLGLEQSYSGEEHVSLSGVHTLVGGS